MVRTPTASYIFACVYLSLYISRSYKREYNLSSSFTEPILSSVKCYQNLREIVIMSCATLMETTLMF